MYNLHTGCILYNTGSEDKLYTDGEVATITFSNEKQILVCGYLLGRKGLVFSAPRVVKGKKFLTIKRVK